MKKGLSILAISVATILPGLTACSSQTDKEMQQEIAEASITGEVTYRERFMFSRGATLKILLQDVSKQDVKAEVIASKVIHITPGKAPPYAFELKYNPNDIQENMQYSVQARIDVSGKLRAVSTQKHDPFASDAPLEIIVKGVGLSPAQQAMDHEKAPTSDDAKPATEATPDTKE